MANVTHGSGDHGSHDHHVIPLKTYLSVFGVLIFLTVITVLAAKVDFGAFNAVVAFGIASVKAGLVLSIFMHLKYDNMMNRVIIGTSVFFLLVLWFFSILDIATRISQQSTL